MTTETVLVSDERFMQRYSLITGTCCCCCCTCYIDSWRTLIITELAAARCQPNRDRSVFDRLNIWCWMTGALCRLSLKPKSLLSLSSTSNFRDPLHIFGNSLHVAYASMHIAFASAPSVPVFCSPLNTSSNSVTRNYCCRGREVTLWFMDTLKFYANFNSAITGTNPYYWALSDPRRVIIVYYAISGYAELLIRRTLTKPSGPMLMRLTLANKRPGTFGWWGAVDVINLHNRIICDGPIRKKEFRDVIK